MQTRTAIDAPFRAVDGVVLETRIGDVDGADADRADAEGDDLLQVRFHHQPRLPIDRLQILHPAQQRGLLVDAGLAVSAARACALDPHLPMRAHAPERLDQIVGGEHRIAGQHARRHPRRQRMRPSPRRPRLRVDERMADDLGGEEGMRHHAAEDQPRIVDAQPGEVVQEHGVTRHVQRRKAGIGEQVGQDPRAEAAAGQFVRGARR